jgi:hypothetical protein
MGPNFFHSDRIFWLVWPDFLEKSLQSLYKKPRHVSQNFSIADELPLGTLSENVSLIRECLTIIEAI